MSGEKHSTNAEKVQAILEQHIQQTIDDATTTMNLYTEMTNMFKKDDWSGVHRVCMEMTDESRELLFDLYKENANNFSETK